eukprot:7131619-Pyramimonas_sp.AAC.1
MARWQILARLPPQALPAARAHSAIAHGNQSPTATPAVAHKEGGRSHAPGGRKGNVRKGRQRVEKTIFKLEQ